MKTKPFQYIHWEFEEDDTKITLSSQIFNNVDDVIEKLDKNVVIALGLNPSNTTRFNDDETNLYLRSKFKDKWDYCEGYILTNLLPMIQPDSNKITENDIDDDHVDQLIQLIEKATDNILILFFGQNGVSLINSKNDKMSKLKKSLSARVPKNTYYTADDTKFSHPSRCKKTFILKEFYREILNK